MLFRNLQNSEAAQGQVRHQRRLLLGGAVLLAACGAAKAPEQRKGEKAAATSPQRYAIAGISPGMTSTQVGVAASRAGYTLEQQSAGPDWPLAIKNALEGPLLDFKTVHRGISRETYRRSGETLSITYVPMPKGNVSTLVRYSGSVAALDYAQAEAELTRRYGRKSFGNTAGLPWAMWCPKQAASARECLNYARLSLSKTNTDTSMSVADPAIEAEQKSALRKNAGARPSF